MKHIKAKAALGKLIRAFVITLACSGTAFIGQAAAYDVPEGEALHDDTYGDDLFGGGPKCKLTRPTSSVFGGQRCTIRAYICRVSHYGRMEWVVVSFQRSNCRPA